MSVDTFRYPHFHWFEMIL